MSTNSGIEAPRRRSAALWLLAALMAAAFAVRLLAADNPLWVDEIFSLYFVNALHSPMGVFTKFVLDNNHYLNSLWMYALGTDQDAIIYRLPAVIFGVLTVPAAYWAGVRRGGAAALLWSAMIAVSQPLIVYSSEARGYAGVVLAAVLAFGATSRWVDTRDWRWGLAAGMIGVFGVLSHLTYGFVWLALLVWTLVAARRMIPRGRPLAGLAAMHGPVIGCAAILYEVNIRHMGLLGGPPQGPLAVTEHLVRVAAGWPGQNGTVAGFLVAAAMVLIFAGIDHVRRHRQSAWVFYAVLVAVPAGLLIFHPPRFLFPRYFLVLVPFVYQLAAILAVRGFQNPQWRGIAAALLVAFGIGQSLLVAHFLQVGRGDPAGGAAFLAAHTPTAKIPITSDRPARLYVELGYDERLLPPGRSFVVVSDISHGVPPWLLLEDTPLADAANVVQVYGCQWRKVAAWDSSDLSGQTWILYERVTQPASTAGSRGSE